jgi:hypothetical protein
VLDELSRQYDILVIYSPFEEQSGKYFTGSFSRKDSIGHILQLLEVSTKTRLPIKNHIVTVGI